VGAWAGGLGLMFDRGGLQTRRAALVEQLLYATVGRCGRLVLAEPPLLATEVHRALDNPASGWTQATGPKDALAVVRECSA
jgi:hypothetical protein